MDHNNRLDSELKQRLASLKDRHDLELSNLKQRQQNEVLALEARYQARLKRESKPTSDLN
jgi:hypothetical protein